MKRIRQIFNLIIAALAIVYYATVFYIGTSAVIKKICFEIYYYFLFQSNYEIKALVRLMALKAGAYGDTDSLQTCFYLEKGSCYGHNVCKKDVLKKYNEIYLTDYKFISTDKY